MAPLKHNSQSNGIVGLSQAAAKKIYHAKHFEHVSFVAILLNTLVLALDSPEAPESQKSVYYALDLAFLVFFTLEMIVRMLSLRVLYKSNVRKIIHHSRTGMPMGTTTVKQWQGYFSDDWNRLDFLVVIVSWVLELSVSSSNVGYIRVLKLLRPLRALRALRTFRDMIESLIAAAAELRFILVLFVFIIALLGIIGLNSFGLGGEFRRRCVVKSSLPAVEILQPERMCYEGSCPSGSVCLTGFEPPENGFMSFDNFAWAFLTLFTAMTLEGWSNVMYAAMSSVSPVASLYFVVVVISANFLVLNMALAVVSGAYGTIRAKAKQAYVSMANQAVFAMQRKGNGKENSASSPVMSPLQSPTNAKSPSPRANTMSIKYHQLSVDVGSDAPASRVSRINSRTADSVSGTPVPESEAPGTSGTTKSAISIKGSGKNFKLTLTGAGNPSQSADAPSRRRSTKGRMTRGLSIMDQTLVKGRAQTIDSSTKSAQDGLDPNEEARGSSAIPAKRETSTNHLMLSVNLQNDQDLARMSLEQQLSGSVPLEWLLPTIPVDESKGPCAMWLCSFTALSPLAQAKVAKMISWPFFPIDYMSAEDNCESLSYYDRVNFVLIGVNVGFMASYHWPMDPSWSSALLAVETIFAIVFTADLAIRISAYGSIRFFWAGGSLNRLDLVIVLVTDILAILEAALLAVQIPNVTFIRAFRASRLLRLAHRWRRLRLLLLRVVQSLVDISNIMVAIVFAVVIYSLLGMQIFGDAQQWEWPEATFRTFPFASLILFEVTTGEAWTTQLYKGLDYSIPFGVMFFCSFYIIVEWVLLNFFIAVILDNFSVEDDVKLDIQAMIASSTNAAYGNQLDDAIEKAAPHLLTLYALGQLQSQTSNPIAGKKGSHYAQMTENKDVLAEVSNKVMATSNPAFDTAYKLVGAYAGPKQPTGIAAQSTDEFHPDGQRQKVQQELSRKQSIVRKPKRRMSIFGKVDKSSTELVNLPTNRLYQRRAGFSLSEGNLEEVSEMAVAETDTDHGMTEAGTARIAQHLLKPPSRNVQKADQGAESEISPSNENLGESPSGGAVSSSLVSSTRSDESTLDHNLEPGVSARSSASRRKSSLSHRISGGVTAVVLMMTSLATFLRKPVPKDSRVMELGRHARHRARVLVSNRWFQNVVLSLVLLSTFLLGLESRDRQYIAPRAALGLELFVYSGFILEFVLKVCAFGFWQSKHGDVPGYFKVGWNRLDFLILVLQSCSIIFPSLSGLTFIRAFRVLRPLRMLTRVKSLQLLLLAIYRSLNDIFNVIIALVFWLFLFGLLGVAMFSGGFARCNVKTMSDKNECIGVTLAYPDYGGESESFPQYAVPTEWSEPEYGFNHIGAAILALFEVSTLEGWLDVMQSAADLRGPDLQPMPWASAWNVLFFVLFILTVSFVIVNLGVGVMVANINLMSGQALLTREQRAWKQIVQRMKSLKPRRTSQRPNGRVRGAIYSLIQRPMFKNFVTAMIFLNVVVMASEFYGQPSYWSTTTQALQTVFISIFALEISLKLVGMGIKDFLRSRWEMFDGLVVLFGVIELILSSIGVSFANVSALRGFRLLLRTFRVVRVVRRWDSLRMLLLVLIESLPAVLSSALLLLLWIFLFAVLGVNMFGLVRYGKGLNRDANFSNVLRASITLFRAATGEDWNTIMYSCRVQYPNCTPDTDTVEGDCGNFYAWAYWVIYFSGAAYMGLNVFLACLMENLSNFDVMRGASPITLQDITIFKRVFSELSDGDHVIALDQVEKVCTKLKNLNSPLGKCSMRNRFTQLSIQAEAYHVALAQSAKGEAFAQLSRRAGRNSIRTLWKEGQRNAALAEKKKLSSAMSAKDYRSVPIVRLSTTTHSLFARRSGGAVPSSSLRIRIDDLAVILGLNVVGTSALPMAHWRRRRADMSQYSAMAAVAFLEEKFLKCRSLMPKKANPHDLQPVGKKGGEYPCHGQPMGSVSISQQKQGDSVSYRSSPVSDSGGHWPNGGEWPSVSTSLHGSDSESQSQESIHEIEESLIKESSLHEGPNCDHEVDGTDFSSLLSGIQLVSRLRSRAASNLGLEVSYRQRRAFEHSATVDGRDQMKKETREYISSSALPVPFKKTALAELEERMLMSQDDCKDSCQWSDGLSDADDSLGSLEDGDDLDLDDINMAEDSRFILELSGRKKATGWRGQC